MGEVNATVFLDERTAKGWSYTHWLVDVGKGQGPVREDVRIVCAETSKRYMSREEAIREAQGRIKVKVEKECGPRQSINWNVEDSR